MPAALPLYSLVIQKSLKLNKRLNNEQPNKLNLNEHPVEQNDG